MSEVDVEQGLDLILRVAAKDVVRPHCSAVKKRKCYLSNCGNFFDSIHSSGTEKQAFQVSPALTNVADGRQKLVVLQTLQDGLHSSLRGAEGGLRAGALTGSNLIIRH